MIQCSVFHFQSNYKGRNFLHKFAIKNLKSQNFHMTTFRLRSMTSNEQQFLNNLQTIHFSMPQMLATLERGDVSFDFVLSTALSHRQPQARYCAWIISHYLPKNKTAIDAHIDTIIAFLPQTVHTGHTREILRWLVIYLPENATREGELFDFCVNLLRSMTIPIGVKTHALTISEIIAKRYPDLLPEYKELLSDILPFSERSIVHKIKRIVRGL